MGISETILAAGIGGAATVVAGLFQLYSVLRMKSKADSRPKKTKMMRSMFSIVALMATSAVGGYLFAEYRQQRALDEMHTMRDELRGMRDELNARLQTLEIAEHGVVEQRATERGVAESSVAEPRAAEPGAAEPSAAERGAAAGHGAAAEHGTADSNRATETKPLAPGCAGDACGETAPSVTRVATAGGSSRSKHAPPATASR